MPTETTLHVRCPHCKTGFRALPEHAGRRAKCSHCGGTIVVPGEPLQQPAPPPSPPPEQPQYVGVNCSLCGTRMYGTLADVGQELKCPDCGRLTKLPPPEIKKKRIPAALEGEQYELWEGDEQPWGAALSTAGPKYVAIECRLCQTHMQAAIDQVGKKIRCLDCGTETVVRLPASGAKAKAKPPAPVDDYELDDPMPVVSTASFYMPDEPDGDFVKSGSEGNKREPPSRDPPLDGDFKERPKLPRWPLLTGNLSFLRSSGVSARLLVMSGSVILPGILLAIISSVGSQILAVILLPPLICIGLIWIAAMAAASVAIVSESSEGNDEVYAWPSSAFMDWLPQLGTMLVALMCSAFPGWMIARLSPELTQIGLLLMGGSVIVLLPITLLSQLAESSVWAVVSPTVVMSWFRCPLSWLGFYLQSIMLLALVGATAVATVMLSGWISVLLVPLIVTAAFYYFRLMGRLAWVIVETTPAEEEDEEKGENE